MTKRPEGWQGTNVWDVSTASVSGNNPRPSTPLERRGSTVAPHGLSSDSVCRSQPPGSGAQANCSNKRVHKLVISNPDVRCSVLTISSQQHRDGLIPVHQNHPSCTMMVHRVSAHPWKKSTVLSSAGAPLLTSLKWLAANRDSWLPQRLLVDPDAAPASASRPSTAAVRSCLVNSPVLMLTGQRTCRNDMPHSVSADTIKQCLRMTVLATCEWV